MNLDLNLQRLDREVARAAAALRAGTAALRRRGPETDAAGAPDNPLDAFRRVSSRTTYLELAGRTPSLGAELGYVSGTANATPDPAGLAAALAEWVQVLTLERVIFADRVRMAAAWHAPSIRIEVDEATQISPREALIRMLAQPTEAGRRAYADALVQGAEPVSAAAQILVERRLEATRLLGVEDVRALEVPCDPPEAALKIAEAVLARTEDLSERVERWDDALARSVGRDAASGWPARLSSRWIEDLFRATRITDGLAIDLGPLPLPLGATSFARALGRFGAALARASSGSAPFALAHPPVDLRRARRAALFAGLVADPVFCTRALGLGRGSSADQARATARAMVVTLRLDAIQLGLVHGAADGSAHVMLLGSRARRDRFEEQTARALGAPIPGALAGLVPELAGAAARLLGALLAARDRRELVERFDEDWFRNPRAAEAIRGEDSAPPAARRATLAELESGLEELNRAIGAL